MTGITLYSCKNDPYESQDVVVYFCDAENKVQDGKNFVFETSNCTFNSGDAQTDEEAFEGKYAIKLDSSHLYGMSFSLEDVEVGEYFEVSVMEKSNSGNIALIAGVSGRSNYQMRTYPKFKENPNEWTRHFLSFTVDTPIDKLTIFTFANGDVAYFDNLEIKRYKQRPPVNVETRLALNIYMPDSSYNLIAGYKEEIVKEEIIRDEYKEYVKAFIVTDKDSFPVKMRIKGDWTDHVITGKTSYRLKTKSGYAFENLRSFSIQHPNTRNYLHEWFVHQLCESEGLLSTKYDFLPVTINGVNQGVYALEEHFDKQLLESRKRREGPILKMDESGFWAKLLLEKQHDTIFHYPFYESSVVSCFKSNRTTKNPGLFAQFKNGAILVELFRKGYANPEDIFNMKKLARFYALMDLANVHHSLAWHNRRFYYDPVTAKLEHIGYDMNPAYKPLNDLIFYTEVKMSDIKVVPENGLNRYIFFNKDFRKHYTNYLKRFSSEAYLDSVFNALDEDIAYYSSLIALEYPGYALDKEFYYEKATFIRQQLDTIEQTWNKFESDITNREIDFYQFDYPSKSGTFFLKEVSVNPYLLKIDSANYVAQLVNYHPNEAEIIGYSVKLNKDSLIPFDTTYRLAAFEDGSDPSFVDIPLNVKPSKVFFRVKNNPTVTVSKKFLKWPKPEGIHPRIELKGQFSPSSPLYKITGEELTFNSGTYQINRLIYIPDEYNIVFEPGTTIDFVNGGGLILNNNVQMVGEENNPIKFTSSDSSSMGITILNADNVEVKFVEIENLSTLDYNGWTLTGAFTVYECDNVIIDNLNIHDNQCEDALNLIRCDFDIQNLAISNTTSDGFDADFCTGIFKNSRFWDTGNDCIDFSGSVVEIDNIDVKNSGDKGISAGERSTLTISNIKINGAITGIASKDHSKVTGSNVTIENAEVGLSAFRKKEEYNVSYIEINNVTWSNLIWPAWIELGSSAMVNGKKYNGVVKYDIDAMYARFEK